MAGIGYILLLNLGGVSESLVRFTQRQERRWPAWMTAGTPERLVWVRLLGLAWIVLAAGIAIWPPE
jgi:hypothetical protein